MDNARKTLRALKTQSYRRRTSQSLDEPLLSGHHNPLHAQPTVPEDPEVDLEAAAAAAIDAVDSHGGCDHSPTAGGIIDARKLWRSARCRVLKEVRSRQGETGEGLENMISLSNGGRQLSMDSSYHAPNIFHTGRSIAGNFMAVLTGNLGAGIVLREAALADSAAMGSGPGMWSPRSDLKKAWLMISSSWLNLLLFCIPIGLVLGLSQGNASWIFLTNFFALVPLALILGEVTEDLAVRFGDSVGGLLNATFGNVVEMILGIAALSKGLYTVVATSLIGSILSNLLLVLGMCFLFGGTRFKEQNFNQMANKVSCSLLFLACLSLMIPSTAKAFYGGQVIDQPTLLNLSHAIALLLAFIYGCYLFFQLKTHSDAFAGESNDETPALSLIGAISFLGVITCIVAICSEFLTGAIEEVSEHWKINQAFLGLIVLPIAGNACEHITAVFVAVKDKMDLAIGVALGSSIQIALFVIPVTVVAGWVMGNDFTLEFDSFSVLMLTMSVILAYFVSSDGSSNWILGLQLVATYFLIGLVFLLEKEVPQPHPPSGE